MLLNGRRLYYIMSNGLIKVMCRRDRYWPERARGSIINTVNAAVVGRTLVVAQIILML